MPKSRRNSKSQELSLRPCSVHWEEFYEDKGRIGGKTELVDKKFRDLTVLGDGPVQKDRSREDVKSLIPIRASGGVAIVLPSVSFTSSDRLAT